ncbi:MAG: hypothetical protein CL927_03295, partial [Deltaproteobacteria bacterium]|nr:hypothetical protein [Deltaproteobacteria bacterium]
MSKHADEPVDWNSAPIGRTRGTQLPGTLDGPAWLTVTTPLLPDVDEFLPMVREILESRWVTNQGRHALTLEEQLT